MGEGALLVYATGGALESCTLHTCCLKIAALFSIAKLKQLKQLYRLYLLTETASKILLISR
jgi:hypothetical protein